MNLEWWGYPLLLLTGAFAGLVDSIAGGGGIITLPVLLNLGFPVPMALGTNKLQASFGSVSAAWHFVQRGAVSLRECYVGIITTFIGAVGGAYLVQQIDARILENLIPWFLAAIVVYTILRPTLGDQDHPQRMNLRMFLIVTGIGLGTYDGFFGPGTGSFWVVALVAVMGFNFVRATAWTKVMNATSNVASLGLFLWMGEVNFVAGLVMGAGQLVGARIGSGLVMKRGARFVRPLFLTMVILTVIRLIWVKYTR